MTSQANKADGLNEIDLTKYTTAALIINSVMKNVIAKCVPGASLADICDYGDSLILSELGKVYTKKVKGSGSGSGSALGTGKSDKKIEKGIAFPVTLCVNNICNNYSPADKNEVLKNGDLVKISMGCHIDGHIAVIGHTIYVEGEEGQSFEEAKSHVLKCAYILSGLMLNNLRAGKTFAEVSHTVDQACKELECKLVPECTTYQMKKYVYEGSKYITIPDVPDSRQDKMKVEEGDIYLIDIAVTSGGSKYVNTDFKTNIYKRDVTTHYELRTNLGRIFMDEVNKKFPVLPFHLKYLEDQRAALMGIPEALRHGLLKPYPVQSVKSGDVVAQFKYTVIVRTDGLKVITGIPCSQLNKCTTLKEIKETNLLDVLKTDFFAKPKPQQGKTAAPKNNETPKPTS